MRLTAASLRQFDAQLAKHQEQREGMQSEIFNMGSAKRRALLSFITKTKSSAA